MNKAMDEYYFMEYTQFYQPGLSRPYIIDIAFVKQARGEWKPYVLSFTYTFHSETLLTY